MAAPLTPHFETENDLATFLSAHGIEHVARLSLGTLASRVDSAFHSQLHAVGARRRLIELANAESLSRWTEEAMPSPKLKEMLPPLAWRFVEEERAAAAEARAALAERLEPPEDPRTHRVHTLLIQLRAEAPDHLAPRPLSALAQTTIDFDPELPGFRLRERRSELALGAPLNFIVPEVRLIFSPTAVKRECSCSAKACVHGLAAIDRALLWLRQPYTEAFGEALEELVRPSWDRTLRALGRAAEESARDGTDFEITWHLDVADEYGVLVTPYIHRRGKKGQRLAGAKVSRRKLLQDHASQLSPADARLAALLPENGGPASPALLLELVDHSEIYFGEATDQLVRVERTKVGLVAEHRGDVIIVAAGIDGAALPRSMADRLRSARTDEPLYHWEKGSRLLTVLDVSAEVRALLGVLVRYGNAFPSESHPKLVEQLSLLAERVPVAMPRSAMGEAVTPLDVPVLRLEAEPGGAVRVQLRTRPLPESTSFVPGEGARDVYVRRGTTAMHAVRNFAHERERAETLRATLPLSDAEPEEDVPFTFRFGSAAGCLALLSACNRENPRPELEWVGEPLQLLGGRGPGALKVVIEHKRNWFGLLGGLSVGGERVELARLLDAARRQERFVRVSGYCYVEIEDALRAHLERLSDHAHVSRHGLEVGPAAVETLTALGHAGAVIESDDTWNALATRILGTKDLHPRVPTALKATLRNYQLDGFRWLIRLACWNAGGILADDMGLGKTVQGLAVLLARRSLGPALVVAPTSVAFNWVDEAARFAPSLRMILFAGSEDRGATLERLGPNDVLVVSYGLLTRDVERLSARHFSTVVFDEAQTLKNALTRRFRAARALNADFKVALSGTPMENHLGELWSLFAVVFPELLGSWEAFRARFAAPIEKRTDPTAAPALARVLQPFLLRRTKAEVEAELPPRTDVRVPVVLSPAEWTLYEDARLAAVSDLETPKAKMRDQKRHVQVLAALTRLRLLASHPRLHDPRSTLASSKLERFLQLFEELRAEGHRALVFSQFTSHLALVREALDKKAIAYEYLDGQTPERSRKARVLAFQEGTAPLFLISLKAGGVGLNLTAANSVIHLDPWWNPAVEDQASDRAHRIGQERPVTVYRLVARGTIEEQMLALHDHKRALVAGVLDGKDLAGRLSTHELMELMSRPASRIATPKGGGVR